MDTTTLNEILKYDPCGQEKGCGTGLDLLLTSLGKSNCDDEPLTFAHILESNGFDDAVWALSAHPDHAKIRRFACDVAEHVLHIYEDEYPDDNRPRRAIKVARLHADGKATDEELRAARNAARRAAAAAGTAPRTVWHAALAAVGAARVARAVIRREHKWQQELFKKYFC